jgi:hypothetical protein
MPFVADRVSAANSSKRSNNSDPERLLARPYHRALGFSISAGLRFD